MKAVPQLHKTKLRSSHHVFVLLQDRLSAVDQTPPQEAPMEQPDDTQTL